MVVEAKRWRRTALLLCAALPVFAVLVMLGNWQVRRLALKEALIASSQQRLAAAPVPLPLQPTFDPVAAQYLKVSFDGVYDHARELHVFAALEDAKGKFSGPGWWIVTPVTLNTGQMIYVNRGFVPDGREKPETRPEGQLAGVQHMAGLIRPPEPRTWVSPADNPAKNQWFVRDPSVFAAAQGLDAARVLPFTVDLLATPVPGGLPQGGETVLEFPNNHLGYAITWYGLAAALAVIAGLQLRKTWKGTSPE